LSRFLEKLNVFKQSFLLSIGFISKTDFAKKLKGKGAEPIQREVRSS